MVLAYLIVGVFAGMIGFIVALSLGSTLLFAIMTYVIVGTAVTFLFPILLLAFGSLVTARQRDAVLTQSHKMVWAPTLGASTTPLAVSAKGAEHGLRILAVDDDAYILELLPKITARVGSTDISLASSGAQAIEIINKSEIPFDCFLLDINMPEMSGIDLCAQIRRMSAYHDTPIIMLTAMTDVEHLDRAFLAGASDYTHKPFDIIEFGERLQAAKAWHEAKRVEKGNNGVARVLGKSTGLGTGWFASRSELVALIEFEALQNYLKRLSGKQIAEACVIAVVVDWTTRNTADTASNVSMKQMARVALAIDDALGGSGYMMSCTGQSEFVLVANAASVLNAKAIEVKIQVGLNRSMLGAETLAEELATITVGAAVRPGRSREDRARTAFSQAIILANDRAAEKRGAFRSASVRPFRQ